MLAFRMTSDVLHGPVSMLADHELNAAIAAEVFHVDDAPIVLTTVPARHPNWTNSESQLAYLESCARRRFGSLICRQELARVAGDVNPRPTPRHRCEAVL